MRDLLCAKWFNIDSPSSRLAKPFHSHLHQDPQHPEDSPVPSGLDSFSFHPETTSQTNGTRNIHVVMSPYIGQLARSPLPQETSAVEHSSAAGPIKRDENALSNNPVVLRLPVRRFQWEPTSRFFAHDLRDGRLLAAVVREPTTMIFFLSLDGHRQQRESCTPCLTLVLGYRK